MNFFRPIAALTSALLHRKPTMVPSMPPATPTSPAPPATLGPNQRPTVMPVPLSPGAGLRLVARAVPDAKAEPTERRAEKAEPPSHGVRLSLRLDRSRHRRLRLAAAHRRRSGQALLIDALDAYFAGMVLPSDGERAR